MSEHIESVNVAVRIFRNHAEGTEDNSKRANSTRLVERLEAASAELVRLYGLTSALPPDLGNVFDLPPELLEELSITKADELEDQLVTVINTYGASLDMILVGLYRKFGVNADSYRTNSTGWQWYGRRRGRRVSTRPSSRKRRPTPIQAVMGSLQSQWRTSSATRLNLSKRRRKKIFQSECKRPARGGAL